MIFKFNYRDLLYINTQSIINCINEKLENESYIRVRLTFYDSDNESKIFEVDPESINFDETYLYLELDEDINDYLGEDEEFGMIVNGDNGHMTSDKKLYYTNIDEICIFNHKQYDDTIL